jgi:hypothetical protein
MKRGDLVRVKGTGKIGRILGESGKSSFYVGDGDGPPNLGDGTRRVQSFHVSEIESVGPRMQPVSPNREGSK